MGTDLSLADALRVLARVGEQVDARFCAACPGGAMPRDRARERAIIRYSTPEIPPGGTGHGCGATHPRPRHSRPRLRARQIGSALLMVLWLSAGLAAIGLSVSSTVRAEADHAATSADGLRAAYLASGAVDRGIQWMLWPSLRRPDGSPMFWAFNERRYTMEFPSGVAVLEAIPEAAKLNVNSATPEDLYRVVFAVSGEEDRARQIVEGILDWRSSASGPTPFDSYYLSITPTFRARHASFQEIEELLLVRGMTPELFYGNYTADIEGRLYARGGLRDCLSVWGGNGQFDVNTASPALMEAMGIPQSAVGAIVARRRIAPFGSMEELAQVAPATPGLTIGVAGSVWTLRATARLRRSDGSLSDAVRSSAATVKRAVLNHRPTSLGPNQGVDRQGSAFELTILRSYDDAWSQDVIPPGAGMAPPGGNTLGVPLP